MTATYEDVRQAGFVTDLPASSTTPSAETDLPPELRIALLEEESEEQLDIEDEDGNDILELGQLRQSASRYQQIMFEHDTVRYTKIEIGQGRTSMKLPWDTLGLSNGAIEKLKKAEASQAAISMLQEIREAGHVLKGMRKNIQEVYFTREGNKWTAIADHYGSICVELVKMVDECNAQRRKIITAYPQARQRFKVALAEIFYEIGDRSQLQIIQDVDKCMEKFPSLKEMKQNFRIYIPEPEFVPSLRSRMEGTANLAEMMQRITSAETSAQEQRAIARIQQLNEQAALQGQSQAVEYFEKKMLRRVAEVLTSLKTQIQQGKLEPGDLGDRNRSMLDNALRDLRIMASSPFASGVADAAESFQEIEGYANSEEVSKTELQREIDHLLEFIKDEYSYEHVPASTGHRAIKRRRIEDAEEEETDDE